MSSTDGCLANKMLISENETEKFSGRNHYEEPLIVFLNE